METTSANRVGTWSSQLSFLYSAAAASIGLGSLWRFPYVAGSNGGGAFVVIYIIFIALLCVPIIIAEMIIGKRGGGSTVASVRNLVAGEGAHPSWRAIGWISLFIPFLGLSYYSVVAGWTLDYARLAVSQGFGGLAPKQSLALFTGLIASPLHQVILQAVFLAGTVFVVARGLHEGVERISFIKMVSLASILVVIVAYNALTIGLGPSLRFLFLPNFSALTPAAILAALGQALFSTGIGVGVLMAYSAFVPRELSVPQSGVLLAIAVVFAASFAGLAIFPTVLHYGLKPGEGPNLIFVTMPIAFGQMVGGRVVSILFFGLVALSAFTAMVGMLVPVVAWLQERTGFGRSVAAAIAGGGIWLIGLPSLLSFNVLKEVHPLGFVPFLKGKTVFDLLDLGIANMLLPLNALLIALFAGWALRRTSTGQEFGDQGSLYWLWRFSLRYLTPLAILVLMFNL